MTIYSRYITCDCPDGCTNMWNSNEDGLGHGVLRGRAAAIDGWCRAEDYMGSDRVIRTFDYCSTACMNSTCRCGPQKIPRFR
jgi:hypothetical protein